MESNHASVCCGSGLLTPCAVAGNYWFAQGPVACRAPRVTLKKIILFCFSFRYTISFIQNTGLMQMLGIKLFSKYSQQTSMCLPMARLLVKTSTDRNVDNQNVDRPKRRQAETSTNQNVDKPKRRQAETSTNQNVDKPKRRQTKTSTSRNVDNSKRRQTKTSTSRNVDKPKRRHS